MNYRKLDASLAIALKDVQDPEEQSLVVFIHTQPDLDPDAIAVLSGLGIRGVTVNKHVFTATLSANAISQLSEQSWVKYVKLSHKLRLMNHTQAQQYQ
ncbi:MAG: hypothetical protein QNJ47_02985 [Nostocaceae cyanobacterium]|nr:hypothetical protein [Nostocaceae cyanobacterium]